MCVLYSRHCSLVPLGPLAKTCEWVGLLVQLGRACCQLSMLLSEQLNPPQPSHKHCLLLQLLAVALGVASLSYAVEVVLVVRHTVER